MLHFVETICQLPQLPSFETQDGLVAAFGKKLFVQV
jgi:hypothetical protein